MMQPAFRPPAPAARIPNVPDTPTLILADGLLSGPPSPDASPEPGFPAITGGRSVALDAFRGLAVLFMLVVNNAAMGRATPSQFTHAPSGEVFLADLVLPGFLFAAGAALPFSSGKGTWWRRLGKMLSRAFWLLALGCLIDSSIVRQPVFGLGVLQIIGLASLVGSLVGFLPPVGRALVAVGLWLAHFSFLLTFPAAGDAVRSTNLALSGWHLSGLLSLAPTAALVIGGSLAGETLKRERSALARFARLLLCGGVATVAGLILSYLLPPSKAEWTSSYVLIGGGVCAMLLGVLALVLPDSRPRWAYPLVAAGANPILGYIGPILVKTLILRVWTWPAGGARVTLETALMRAAYGHFGRTTGGWVWTLGFVAAAWLVLLVLYKKRIFLRV